MNIVCFNLVNMLQKVSQALADFAFLMGKAIFACIIQVK